MDNNIRTGLGMRHLESLKNKTTYLLRNGLKIARLALVDVSNAELMTEEATNADEWGPTTKQMAKISCSVNNSEDYLRIVHVLHKRFALTTQTFWRQIHKSLILLEYLLCHGPEHLVMEFRPDKSRIEDYTRFAYVDLNGVDRGSALQKRAKHVLHLLVDEAFYKKERTRAQKISSGISGFGNENLQPKSARSKLFPGFVPCSQSAFVLSENGLGGDSTSLLGDEDDHCNSEPDRTGKTFRSQSASSHSTTEPEGEFSSPPSTSETSSWRAFSSSSGGESRSTSGRSTNSTVTSDASTNEESPTHTSSFPKTSQILDMDSVASELENHNRTPSLQKLPPPPPKAGYKCVARVRRPQPESVKRDNVSTPDLISI